MKKKYYFNIYLYLSLIAFFVAIAVVFLYNTQDTSFEEKQLKSVKANVRQELNNSKKFLEKISKDIKDKKVNFENFIQNNPPYPFLIYKNKELLFWSDYRFLPNYDKINGNYEVKTFSFKRGKYTIFKRGFLKGKADIEVYVLMPLYTKYAIENKYLRSHANPKIVSDSTIRISLQAQKQEKYNIYSDDRSFLFSLRFRKSSENKQTSKYQLVSFATAVGFILLGIYTLILVKHLMKDKAIYLAFLVLVFYLVLLRSVMILCSFPSIVVTWALFDPKYYTLSIFSASLGDVLINIFLLAGLIAFIFIYWKSFKKTFQIKPNLVLSIFIFLISYGLTFFYFYILSTLYEHSQVSIDISKNIDFAFLGWASLLIFCLLSFVYLSLSHFIMNMVQTLPSRQFFLALIFAGLAFSLAGYFLGFWHWGLSLLHLVYFTILFFTNLPKYVGSFSYNTLLYLLVSAFFCAILGTYTLYSFNPKQNIETKRKFANSLIPENDEYAEFLLNEAIQDIRKDKKIIRAFAKDRVHVSKVKTRIQTSHLAGYFNTFQTKVLLFDAPKGNLLGKNQQAEGRNYFYYIDKYQNIWYETDYQSIYFVDNSGVELVKSYICLIDLDKNNKNIGYIVIDLKQRRSVPTNVYPELLVSQSVLPPIEMQDYSYAVYDNNQLAYSVGSYNYDKYFNTALFDKDELTQDELLYNGSKHLAVFGGFKRNVVVSTPAYSWVDIFSNFSFLFLLLVLSILVIIFVYNLKNRFKRVRASFATRIQLYLNIAFFLPLLVVSIITLSIISKNYKEDFDSTFISKTESVSFNLASHLESYSNQNISLEKFSEAVLNIAHYVEADINVFDKKGKLISASQPSIYEKGGVLSNRINPEAFLLITKQRNKQVMLNEAVGQLNYKSVYVPIKSYNNELLGIVSIPFFEARYELQRKLIRILSIIINIFASIFIVFIFLSYFASQVLTIPLRLITQKIKATTFEDYNEPLDWDSEDEIGLFVNEYNKMLKKLDESKEELARSQKESAWREMAKQVAHEIKNPLTPMKLTLQHMNMRLENQNDKIRSLFERSFDTLLIQIETLNDIATSFSSFAKMPIPKSEKFELSEVLRRSQDLYKNENIDLDLEVEDGKFWVKSDKKLLGRIFTNLIKNAIESVDDQRRIAMQITLKKASEGVLHLAFKDNGDGIPADIQKKIFIPNFTTKSSGSGIGLAVARRGIEHAGGRIWFETEEGSGTTFFIEMPLV